MQYRIRKDKYSRYIPEVRGWSTLWIWMRSEHHDMFSYREFGLFTEENAIKTIAYEKEVRATKETYQEIT